MKKIILLAGLLASLLSGCSTYTLMATSSESHEFTTLSRDQIVAFGRPQAPVPGFENAVVFVGQKYSYFAQPAEQEGDAQLFLRIMQGLNMERTSLLLFPHATGQDTLVMYQDGTAQTLQKSEFNDVPVTVVYKGQGPLSAQEQQQLAALNFKCEQSYCQRRLSSKITLAQRPRSSLGQQWQISRPTFFDIRKEEKARSSAPLYPLAIGFDLVTLPVQLAVGTVASVGVMAIIATDK